MSTTRTGRSRGVWLAALLAVALLGAGCGGGDDDADGDDADTEAEGTPVSGGELVYGLEAETSGGWCLPEAQLAISGIQVARTIYDTLTAPDEDGEYVPFLAESVEPNEDDTEWTITLRDGVTFHDGSPLTAEVVKNNLDAYRGAYEGREPLLFLFVFDDIAGVEVVDDLTLKVTTLVPWPSLPAFLHGSGRIGIMAQAQLDDPEACDRNLIGTGPFVLEDWTVNDSFTAVRNPDYWDTDADGNALPYLDRITYRPIIEENSRTNALLSGQLGAIHTNTAGEIEVLTAEADSGTIDLEQSSEYPEVSYVMFNASKAPFDSATARQAVAHAIDRDLMNQVRFLDVMEMASGPFGPGNIGYLEDTGFPEVDTARATELAEQYEAEAGEPLSFTMTIANSTDTQQTAAFIQEQLSAVGIEMSIEPIEQAAQISTAIGNEWQSQYWRNHPGGDPDSQYVWWYEGSPVNFGKFADQEINDLLDEGRTTADEDRREEIYQDLNRRFAEEVYNVWTNWSLWTIGTQPGVNGIYGPDLPDGSGPFPGLASAHPVTGIWVQP